MDNTYGTYLRYGTYGIPTVYLQYGKIIIVNSGLGTPRGDVWGELSPRERDRS